MLKFETTTIYHKEITPDGIEWSANIYPTCFVHFQHNSVELISDRLASNDAIVRVFTDKNICNVGDMLCFGEIKDAVPPDDALVIFEVTEAFKGNPDIWHVKIRAR